MLRTKSQKLEGTTECRRCYVSHYNVRCFKKEWICFVCKKPGHLVNKCRFKFSVKGNNLEQEKEVNDHHEKQKKVVLGSITKISEQDIASMTL